MSLSLPTTLSPSKVSSFTDCGLAFQLSNIDQIPTAPTVAMSKGTLVHATLERLLDLPATDRTMDQAMRCLDDAANVFRSDPDFTGLNLNGIEETGFLAEAETLVRRYFEMEDPRNVKPIGLELGLCVEINGLRLRGIIDRLELNENGDLVVTDYKTGKSPIEQYENTRLGGVQFYSYLCEQLFGVRPAEVRLMYLGDGVQIIAHPTPQTTRGFMIKTSAVWDAIRAACATDGFQPRVSKLCDWCDFKDCCPAHGGDPTEIRAAAALFRWLTQKTSKPVTAVSSVSEQPVNIAA